MAEVKTPEELSAALKALPKFSRNVYDTKHGKLYAEPGFSDVTVKDVATTLGCTQKAVNAAIKHLLEVGLIWTYEFDCVGNAKGMIVLGTYEHSEVIART